MDGIRGTSSSELCGSALSLGGETVEAAMEDENWPCGSAKQDEANSLDERWDVSLSFASQFLLHESAAACITF